MKHQSPFIHHLCEQHLMKDDEGYQRIYATRNIKRYIDAIKFEYVRRSLDVQTQNEYLQYIFAFHHEYGDAMDEWNDVDFESIRIRECDSNQELGIDWWRNKGDYRTIMIREVIFGICSCNGQKRREHDLYARSILNAYFKDSPIHFAELIREHFMETMEPKRSNTKYPAFQVYYLEDPEFTDRFVEISESQI